MHVHSGLKVWIVDADFMFVLVRNNHASFEKSPTLRVKSVLGNVSDSITLVIKDEARDLLCQRARSCRVQRMSVEVVETGRECFRGKMLADNADPRARTNVRKAARDVRIANAASIAPIQVHDARRSIVNVARNCG